MKARLIFTYIFSMLITASFAQGIETDDMYFNSSDRAKLRAQKASSTPAYASVKKNSKSRVEEEQANPTDSYSARNVNPEFAARSNAQSAQTDDENYFDNDYQRNTASNLNSWNNDFNSWYGSPWYQSNYYAPHINSWNTPYYGSRYDSWGNPWNNPHYRSGWSSSFSYHWGNSYNYGWGNSWNMNMGYGSPYYDPWFGPSYSSWHSPYSYWGRGGGYGYYPTNVIIVENGNSSRHRAYGKRNSRSNAVTTNQANGVNRSSNVSPSINRRSETGSRTSSNSNSSRQAQSEYYNKSWRNQTREESTPNTTTNTTQRNNSAGRTSSYSTDNNNSQNTWRQSGSNSNSNSNSTYNRSNSNNSYTPSRSSSGTSRSSSGTSGSSSPSPSRSRGR